jgi:hypothetical protein
MGIGNRAKRAAGAKRRAKDRARRAFEERASGGSGSGSGGYGSGGSGSGGSGSDRGGGLPTVEELATALLTAAELRARGDTATADAQVKALVGWPFTETPGLVSRAVEMAALDGLTHCWRVGWQPADLWHVTRRRLPAALGYLVDLLAIDAARHSDAALAPAWSAQLRRLDVEVWWRADQPHLDQWTARHTVGRVEAVALVVDWLAMLRLLPRMSELVPPPGTPAARTAAAGATRRTRPEGVEEKVLTRVRALLAKAESTEFAEEADAFFAKAQELMSRYSLERAMLDADAPEAGAAPGGRRIWLDAPYVSAKSLLINQVAQANRSRTVFHSGLDCVTVLGDEVDLELVEVLSTSLLVHASTAMVAAGRQQDRYGQSRTKSFRQSFLVSYATRIGERLTVADSATAEAMAGELGDGRLLPVLAARGAAVEQLVEQLFPALTKKAVSVSNAAGWGAGRVAADLADLDVRRAVRR